MTKKYAIQRYDSPHVQLPVLHVNNHNKRVPPLLLAGYIFLHCMTNKAFKIQGLSIVLPCKGL